jgi:hypothetical protein
LPVAFIRRRKISYKHEVVILQALGARLEFIGRLVAGRADLVGAQAVQQVVAAIENSQGRPKNL